MIEGKTLRSDLHHLARALRALHGAMMDEQRRTCIPAPGVTAPASQTLMALDPHFSWLLKVAHVVNEVDEYLDDEEAPAIAIERDFHTEVEQLVGPLPPTDPAFRLRYDALRQRAPKVAAAHAALALVLIELASTPQP